MTGDGVNDAPALKQAEVGVAVSSATDVAKAAASLVLTSPGLSNLVSAIETSRRIYQRMLTYTLNKIIKTIEIAFFLSFGLIFTHTFVTTPLLMVLLLFTNDFVTMTISTDRVKPSQLPNRWNVRSIVMGSIFLALPILALVLWDFLVCPCYFAASLSEFTNLVVRDAGVQRAGNHLPGSGTESLLALSAQQMDAHWNDGRYSGGRFARHTRYFDGSYPADRSLLKYLG